MPFPAEANSDMAYTVRAHRVLHPILDADHLPLMMKSLKLAFLSISLKKRLMRTVLRISYKQWVLKQAGQPHVPSILQSKHGIIAYVK